MSQPPKALGELRFVGFREWLGETRFNAEAGVAHIPAIEVVEIGLGVLQKLAERGTTGQFRSQFPKIANQAIPGLVKRLPDILQDVLRRPAP